MAPFPNRHSRKGSNSLLPTMHSFPPTSSSSSSTSTSAYPPLPPSAGTTPSHSPRVSATFQSYSTTPPGSGDANQVDPRALFGTVSLPTPGNTGGLGGITYESRETVRRCLEVRSLHSLANLSRHPSVSFPWLRQTACRRRREERKVRWEGEEL
jgi:hypothetical protein